MPQGASRWFRCGCLPECGLWFLRRQDDGGFRHRRDCPRRPALGVIDTAVTRRPWVDIRPSEGECPATRRHVASLPGRRRQEARLPAPEQSLPGTGIPPGRHRAPLNHFPGATEGLEIVLREAPLDLRERGGSDVDQGLADQPLYLRGVLLFECQANERLRQVFALQRSESRDRDSTGLIVVMQRRRCASRGRPPTASRRGSP